MIPVQTVQNTFKSDAKLHLVQEDVIYAVVFDLFFQVCTELLVIAQLLVFIGVQCDGNDTRSIYTAVYEIVAVQSEQKKGFPAAADSSNNLDGTVLLALNQPV